MQYTHIRKKEFKFIQKKTFVEKFNFLVTSRFIFIFIYI